MKQYKLCIFLALFLFLHFNAYADSTHNSESVWGDVQFAGSIFNLEKWKYRLELHAHSPQINSTNDKYGGIFRVGIGRILNQRQEIWTGYDAVPIFQSGEKVDFEQRLWQQLSWSIFENRKNQWDSRTRLEERKDEDYSAIALRLRQRFTVSINHKIFWRAIPIIYDEIFFNLNHPCWVTNQPIDQNRLFLGFKFPIGANKSLQIGYLNQFKIRDPQNQMVHVLSVSFGINTDLVLDRAFDFFK